MTSEARHDWAPAEITFVEIDHHLHHFQSARLLRRSIDGRILPGEMAVVAMHTQPGAHLIHHALHLGTRHACEDLHVLRLLSVDGHGYQQCNEDRWTPAHNVLPS